MATAVTGCPSAFISEQEREIMLSSAPLRSETDAIVGAGDETDGSIAVMD